MDGFLRLLISIWQQYGMGAVQIAVILLLFGKLFNNHLKHIADSIQSIMDETKCVSVKVSDLSERVSYMEGKLNVPTRRSRPKKRSTKR